MTDSKLREMLNVKVDRQGEYIGIYQDDHQINEGNQAILIHHSQLDQVIQWLKETKADIESHKA